MDYKAMLAEAEVMKTKAQEMRQNEIAVTIDQIKALLVEHDLKPADVFPEFAAKVAAARKRKPAAPSAPKYREPNGARTWTGKGRQPEWVRGHIAKGGNLTDIAIAG